MRTQDAQGAGSREQKICGGCSFLSTTLFAIRGIRLDCGSLHLPSKRSQQDGKPTTTRLGDAG